MTMAVAYLRDVVYPSLLSLLRNGAYEKADDVLVDVVNRGNDSPDILLGYLTVTFAWRHHLAKRQELLAHTKQRLIDAIGEERAAKAIYGLDAP